MKKERAESTQQPNFYSLQIKSSGNNTPREEKLSTKMRSTVTGKIKKNASDNLHFAHFVFHVLPVIWATPSTFRSIKEKPFQPDVVSAIKFREAKSS